MIFCGFFAATTTTTPATPVPTASVPPPTSDPDVDPKQGSWNLTKDGRTCVLTVMGIRLAFDYVDEKNVVSGRNLVDTGTCY